MKLNKIDEVWIGANSLFKWRFRFVVIQKFCYHDNVTYDFSSLLIKSWKSGRVVGDKETEQEGNREQSYKATRNQAERYKLSR